MRISTPLFFVCFLSLITINASGQDKELKNFFSSSVSTNSKQDLFDDISFGGFDLVSTNFKFTKDNSLQKAVISPFKLMQKSSILNDSRFNVTQKDGTSTFGAAFALDNTNPYNKLANVRKKFAQIPKRQALREKNEGESDAEYKRYLNEMELQGNKDRINYLKSLARNAFSFTIGYNISLFEVIGGDKFRNNDSLTINEYSTKAHTFSVDLSYAANEKLFFSTGYSHARKRKNAEENQKMISYNGFNIGANWRVIPLQNKRKTRT